MPANLTVTRSTSFFQDNDEQGVYDVGDVLYTRVTINNIGTTSAFNVSFQDNFRGTTLVNGTLNVSPIATSDSFTAVANTVLRVGGAGTMGTAESTVVAGNLLTNDRGAITGDQVPGLNIDVVTNGVTAKGGAFNIFADGSFNYLNDGNDTEADLLAGDSFTYTVRDAGLDGMLNTADDLTSTATVSITFARQGAADSPVARVWYVDGSATTDGTGTSANPFQSSQIASKLNGASDVDSAGHVIYVENNATGTIALEASQSLIGTGAALTVAGFNIAAAGTNSSLSSASGTVVTLSTDNTVSGITINANGASVVGMADGNGSVTTSGGTLNVSNVTFSGSGQAIDIDQGGNLNMSITSLTSSGSANQGVQIAGTAASGTGLISGTVSLGSGTISGSTGAGILIGTPGGATANAGGTVSVSYAGVIQNTGGALLEVQDKTGGTVSLSGNMTDSANTSGAQILIDGSSGTTVNLTGQTLTLTGTTGNGVSFTNNANSTFNINSAAGGLGLDVTTTTGKGFVATGNSNSTVTVAGTGNSISSGTGTALEVQNTNIGSGGLNFVSIAANGAANGILLNTAGSAGGLNVTGTGASVAAGTQGTIAASRGTGGTIQNTTGDAISITGVGGGVTLKNMIIGDGTATTLQGADTTNNIGGDGINLVNSSNIVLENVRIARTGGHGIEGTGVVNLTLRNTEILNAGDAAAEDGLNFAGGNTNELSGTLTVADSVVTASHGNNLYISNHSGNLAGTVSNTRFGTISTVGNDSVGLETLGTAGMNLTFTNGVWTGAPGDLLGVNFQGSGGNNLTVTNGTFSNNSTAIATGGGGVSLFEGAASGLSTINITGSTFRDSVGHAVLIVKSYAPGNVNNASSTLSVNFTGNTIGVQGTANSGSLEGDGIKIQHAGGNGSLYADIVGNSIYQFNNFGINMQAGAGLVTGGLMSLEVEDNIVASRGNNAAFAGSVFQGIMLNSGVTPGDNFNVYLQLDNNSAAGTGVNGGTDYRIRQRQSTTVYLSADDAAGVGGNAILYTGGARDPAAVNAFVLAHNPGGTASSSIEATNGGGVQGAAPPQPILAAAPPSAQEQAAPPPSADEGEPVESGQDNQQHGDPVPADDGASGPVVVDDGILSQAELALIVEAAIQRWIAAGATEAQIAAMRAVSFTVSDLGGLTLGSSGFGTITLDDDAAGWRWFVDATPDDDSEYTGSGTQLAAADRSGLAGTRIDLLTVVTHELGHQIGLVDTYAPGETDELMFGTVGAGERRLPGSDDAASASGSAVAGAFAISPISLGTIESGQTVVIEWRHTVDNPGEDRLAGYWTGQSTVTYEGGEITPFTVTSDADTGTAGTQAESGVIDSLSFGNLVFLDRNKNGVFDAGDTGIAGVTLSLFADTNNDGHWDSGDLAIVFDDNNGNGTYEAGIDDPLPAGTGSSAGVVAVQLTATTDANGLYSFAGLAPGDYIAVFNASNFLSGGALHTRVVGVGGKDPNDTNADNDAGVVAPADVDVDNDNNGEISNGTTATRAVRLDYGQEPGGDVNNSVDVAFVQPNQAPSGTDSAVALNEDTARTLAVADFGYSDPENNALLEIVINSVSGGTLTVNGTAVTTFPATITPEQLNANEVVFTPTQNLNGTAAASILFQVRDNGGTANGGVDTDQSANTLTFNLTAVNDPISTNAPATLTLDEDSVNFAVTGLSISDVDAALAPSGVYTVSLSSTNGTLTLTTLTGLTFTTGDGTSDASMTFRGTLANLNTALATAKFTPTANYAGSAAIQFSATDTDGTTVATGSGAATSDSDTIAVTVTAVNDAPVLDLNGAAAGKNGAGFAVEQDPTGTGSIAPNATVVDVDSANFDTGTLTVSITVNPQDGDRLGFGAFSGGPGAEVAVSGNEIRYNGTLIATFTGGDHDTPLVVTFNASATAAAVQGVVRAVAAYHDGDAPSASVRTLTYTLTDGDGGSDSATATVTISPDNDAPDLTAPTAATIGYTEGANAIKLMQGVTLSDLDLPANFAGGSLTVSVSGVGGGINLDLGSNFRINNNGNNTFTLAYQAGETQIAIGTIAGFGTSTLTVSNFAVGATLARLNELVVAFTYVNLNDNPGSADRTVTMTFNDGNNTGSGSDVALTDTVTQTLQITPVNDAPVNSLGAKITTSEDATGVWLSGMSISDPDADPANDTVYVTFQVANGRLDLRLDVAGGLRADDILATSESGDLITVASTLNKINATLAADNGLTYAPKANFNGDDTLTVTSNDGGANGVDPGLTAEATNEEDVDTRTITVSAVNDAPTSADDSVTTSEDDAYTFTLADFPFSDIDGHTLSGVRITGLPAGGTLRVDGDPVADEQVISTFDIRGGLLTYTPNADQIGSPYDSFKFTVIDNGSPANGAAVESGEQTMTVNVTPDNLAPVVDLNGAGDGVDYSTSFSEGGAAVAIGSGIVVSDSDSGAGDQIVSATVAIVDALVGDKLTLSGALPSGITVDEQGSSDFVLKLTGAASQADYQAALALVRYSSTSNDPDVSGTDTQRTITVIVNDGDVNSAPATATIDVSGVNDGPANSVPGQQNATEDTDFVFSAGRGNAITVSDPDAGGGDMTVTLSVTSGTLTLASVDGLAVTDNGTAMVKLTGTAAEINHALNGLVYRGTLNFEGDDTLTILTSDNGLSGTGGEKTDSDEVLIKVADDGFINGDAGNNVLNGTPQRDIFLVQQGGNDTVNGLGGRDVIYFGDAFTAEDSVNGGGNSDIVILQGNYLAPTSIGSITNLGQLGSISLFSSSNNLYGGATAGLNNYNLVATNDTVAAGLTLKINATGLQVDEDLTFDGSAELDGSFQIYGGKGTDHLTGGVMGDNFVFTSGTWDASDRVIGGGGYDVLYLRGDYSFTFGANQLSGIESIGLLSATEKLFASGGDEFDYEIDWNDAALDVGQTITINGSRLTAEESMDFDGSTETAGNFRLFGGMGTDVLTGGAGNDLIYGGLRGDTLTGGAGNDVFRYQSVLESNSVERDGIQDFTLGDLIDLSRIDADVLTAGNQAFNFIGSAAFSHTAGELRFQNFSNGGPIWLIQGDVDGDGVSDLEIVLVITDNNPITAGDFML
jgi:hypothetical protein